MSLNLRLLNYPKDQSATSLRHQSAAGLCTRRWFICRETPSDCCVHYICQVRSSHCSHFSLITRMPSWIRRRAWMRSCRIAACWMTSIHDRDCVRHACLQGTCACACMCLLCIAREPCFLHAYNTQYAHARPHGCSMRACMHACIAKISTNHFRDNSITKLEAHA